jgi:hypothetical protein
LCGGFEWVVIGMPSATYFLQPKKVSKKGRPSSAERAGFPQIPLVGTRHKVAYGVSVFRTCIVGGNGAENRGWSGPLGVETEIEKGSKY